MKNLSPILIASFVFSFVAASCSKENESESLSTASPIDSGVYNPDSHFPLKLGAKWIYQHYDGTWDTVNCGPRESKTVKTGHHVLSYSFHRLISNAEEGNSYTHEPILSGEFSEAGRQGNYCIKFGMFTKRFMAGSGFQPGQFYIAFTCPTSGGPSTDNVFICLNPRSTLNGFNDVANYIFTSYRNIDNMDTTSQGTRVNLPVTLKPNSDYTESWYAKGVGLIKTQRFSQGVLVDGMELKSYSIPH